MTGLHTAGLQTFSEPSAQFRLSAAAKCQLQCGLLMLPASAERQQAGTQQRLIQEISSSVTAHALSQRQLIA